MTSETGQCICCGGRGEPHLRGLLRCAQCTHVWADMSLSEEELRRLYDRSYFEGEEYLDYGREEPALRRNFRARLRELLRRAPAGSRLWEIGAAYGFFLREASGVYSVGGCDISEHAARCARERLKVDVQHADYLDLATPAEPVDIICLWDTVEHLAAPHRYLEKAASELRVGGTLALSTGDIGSMMARLRGDKWRLIHPPSHLHYFTARSMRVLLERLGFEQIRFTWPPFWRSADAVAYRLLAHPQGAWTTPLYRALRVTGLTRLVFPLNTWDLMTVYAVRGGRDRKELPPTG